MGEATKYQHCGCAVGSVLRFYCKLLFKLQQISKMSSGFITESEALDIRKKRQEEWERVRTEKDPIERPEDPLDNRSLYDRLQEQKQKKDLEYEEAHKLKNMIKGLDDDEIDFLNHVDRSKEAIDNKKKMEEQNELNDYRNRVASFQEAAMDQKLHANILTTTGGNKMKNNPNTNAKSQLKLLKGAIVTKTKTLKRKPDDEKTEESVPEKVACPAGPADLNPNLKCIGILPGLGNYNSSSSDDTSDSDSDVEVSKRKIDLLGRKIEEKEAES